MQLSKSIALSLGLLAIIVSGGTVGYTLIEGWGFVDSLWMVVITLTTIGYSEVAPLSTAGRLFTILLIASGLSVGTYAMSRGTRAVLEGELARALTRRKQRKMMQTLVDHYVVVGYGRLGRAVAQELIDNGYAVCVIDRGDHEELPPPARRSKKLAVIEGDGSSDEVLRAAGIDRAQGLAVTAAPVAEAIFITLSARQLVPDIPIMTRVETDEEAVKARRAGATGVVSPHAMGGWRMAHGLVRPHSSTFLDLATLAENEDLLLDEVEVDAHCKWCGHTLMDLNVSSTHGVLVVAVRRAQGQMEVTPSASTRIDAGDVLIVIGVPARVRAFARTLVTK